MPERTASYIVNEIHTDIVATVDDQGLPVTAAIDMMDSDGKSLYFLTARGKSLHDRLTRCGFLTLTAIKGESTLTSIALSLRGRVRELGYDRIPVLFEKNPYMKEVYPTGESRQILTVFQIYEGGGKWFDLSKKPIERASFFFSSAERAGRILHHKRMHKAAQTAWRSVHRTVSVKGRPLRSIRRIACIAATA